MKPVLLLQHSWDDPAGYLGELLTDYALPYEVVNVEKDPLPQPEAYQAIISLGGPQHVHDLDSFPYLKKELAFLCRAVEHEIPYLGICLGAQLLAVALGGEVYPHTTTEIGFSEVELTPAGADDPLFAGFSGRQKVFQWHEDTFSLPEGAIQLARNAVTEQQAFRYGLNAYALQYHIEINAEILDLWLYHPANKASMLDTLGEADYQKMEQEITFHVSDYRAHTRLLGENFLRISHFIT
ncbi:type 1 glutamine amidotransferase [Tengunoibacter tsumagoiensis]|uniref:GMP synthase n=1 Tax=Tengunoibacter tsumagoiensis TaxID=2014871 RepID=A0A401ZZ75_9CHLR|nr:type 1 glutamine amidotransferase [Tengunoibacter tsumagoiensis]GCE12141.1 GMP synthase [Tengunoibacter tsumagoiensis]